MNNVIIREDTWAKQLSLRVCTILLLASFTAIAQEDEAVEEVTVTGSRIERPEFSQPSPVVTLDAQEIERFATSDVGLILAELPSIGATATLAGNTSATETGTNELAGNSSADLRRLDETRTLVLINGRRQVASVAGTSQVDLSTVPTALIERIDIVTGGASAVYGSDAVSGVVNVILKDKFEGMEVNLRGADSTESVNSGNYSASILAGKNFLNDRANFTGYVSYDKTEETLATDIRQYSNFSTIVNPANTGENDGIPDRLVVANVVSELINATGVINPFGGPTGVTTFDNAGNPMQQQMRDGTNSFAFGSFTNGCTFCFATEDYENYLPEVERVTIGGRFNYEINDNNKFYADLRYVESEVLQLFQPSFRFGSLAIDVVDNPYLDDGLRQNLLATGQTNVLFAKFFDEIGLRVADNDRELLQYSTGFEGDFDLGGTEIRYDVYYGKGEADNTRTTPNDQITDNLTAAIDSVIDPATGQPACRSQVPSAQGPGFSNFPSVNPAGCVPYNPFGFQQASPEARAYVAGSGTRTDKIDQEVFSLSFVTDTGEFLNLPGGPIDVVLGFERREESSTTISDGLIRSGVLGTAATPNAFGEFDVDEYFLEFSFPLLKDARFAHELTLDAAYRDADYSHAGSADAWKVGLMYAPVESFRLRGTIGEAVRAPSVSEAFDPQSPGFAQIDDPCDADNINDDPDRPANCAALGIPPGFQANDNASINVLSGGNPNLVSEDSESYTVGFIWQPNFVDNLDISVDYYDIEITDAIISVLSQDILDNCVDATGGLDANFCSQIDRNPVTNDVDLVRSGFLNAAALNTDGVQLAVEYQAGSLERFNLPGQLALKFNASWLLSLERFEFQDRPDEINVEDGEEGDPDFQYRFSATYLLDRLSVNWTTRFLDRVADFDVSPGGDIPEDREPAFIASQTTHDLSATYEIRDGMTLYGGIRNLFDQTPPGFTKDPMYDHVGRRAFLGLRAKF